MDVLERSQMAYENGSVLCSPTTVSMLLSFWSKKLKRADLDRDVPRAAVHDVGGQRGGEPDDERGRHHG